MKRAGTSAVIFALLAGVALLAVLFTQTRAIDAERHARASAVLASLKQLDTRLDADVARVASLELRQYDRLVRTRKRIQDRLDRLQAPELGVYGRFGGPLDGRIDTLATKIERKFRHTERLKSAIAVLRNARDYLPTLVRRNAGAAGARDTILALRLVNALLDYTLSPDPALRERLAARRKAMAARLQDAPDHPFAGLLNHVRASLDAVETARAQRAAMRSLDVRAAIDTVRDLYENHYITHSRWADAFRLVLLVVSGLLMAALAWLFHRLHRAHARAEDAWTQLRDAVESLGEGFALFDPRGRLVLANSRFARFYPWLGAWLRPGADRATLEEHLHASGRVAQVSAAGLEAERPDADAPPASLQQTSDGRYLLARDTPTSDGGVACVRVDVTRRQADAERLRKLSRAITQSPLAIFITDRDGIIEYVNPTFESLTGYEADDVLGRTPRILASGHTPAETYQDLWQTITSGQPWHGEILNRKKDGTLYWEDATVAPVRDADGAITHYVALKADVTARKEKDARLQQTMDALARSNAELERFAQVAAHDLQEPTRQIVTFSQLLGRHLRDDLDSTAREYLDYVMKGASHMKALVNDLLVYSRVESEARSFAPVDMNALVARVRRDVADRLADAGAELDAEPLPGVDGDPDQLFQVLWHLVTNAIKFADPHKPLLVRITAGRTETETVFYVRDTGQGFDPAYAEQIFVIFKRLHTPDRYPGTGVGLALCHRIVARHGGRIWATSEPGKGTTVTFTVPLKNAELTGKGGSKGEENG